MVFYPHRILIFGLVVSVGLIPNARSFGQLQSDLKKKVDELATKSDPQADDWTTEILADKAGKRLSELAHRLDKPGGNRTKDLAPFFTEKCFLPDFRNRADSTYEVDAIEVEKYGSPEVRRVSPEKAFESLIRSFAPTASPRIKFKVVGVEVIDDHSFKLDVYYQAVGEAEDKKIIQQNAEWTLTLDKGDADELLISRIEQSYLAESMVPPDLLVDCTRSIITDDRIWHPQLSNGCEYWYGRIDAVGEINFMGHNGIAVGDVNGDGLDDLYVAQGTGLPNRLFVQLPDGTVRDTAVEAGVAWLDDTKGVLLVDVDNDDDQDLLCAMGPTIVYCQNDGRGIFKPKRALRAATPASFYSLAAADYDGDGDLDIYGCRYVKLQYGVSVPMPLHDANNGPSNHLLRNDGDRGFVDVTSETGLHINNARFSLAATWVDYDDDGDPDLYVTNDFGRNNLYRNDGGNFTDIAAEAGVEDQAAGMGASWSDVDLDGDLDLYVSNMFSSAGRRIAYQSRFMSGMSDDDKHGVQRHSLGNSLLICGENRRFVDESDKAGVRMGRWAWGSKFIDLNNDGYEDIVVPNGFLTNLYKDDL